MQCECCGTNLSGNSNTKISLGSKEYLLCDSCQSNIQKVSSGLISGEDLIASNVDYINNSLVNYIRSVSSKGTSESKTPKCPHCNHELNQYEIDNRWCTNCNAKFTSLTEIGLEDDAPSENASIKQMSAYPGYYSDEELCEKMVHNGTFFRNIFFVVGTIQAICGLFSFFGITNLVKEAGDEGGILTVFLIIPIIVIVTAIIWFAIGNYICFRMLGLARLIEQNNRK